MNAQSDKYYVYRPLLDLIGKSEGTDKGRGYNETLAYGAYTGGPVDLVSMTLAQLDALQTKMLRHPRNSLKSSACGRYQIVRTTARSIREKLPVHYPLTRKFDRNCQDEMACYLLGLRGIDKYLAGRLKLNSLINNLAQEWASLPTTEGKGHYDGQRASVTVSELTQAIAEVKRRHIEGQPKQIQEIDRPVVPETIPKEVDQKTNWLTTAFGSAFSLGGLGAWLAGLDKETLITWATIGAVSTIAVLIAGKWMVRQLKGIAEEINS